MRYSSVVILAASLLVMPLNAKHAKVGADVDTKKNGMVDVIVQFGPVMSAKQHDKVKKKNGILKAELKAANGALYSIPATELEGLADDEEVTFITPDRAIKATLEYAQPTIGADLTYNSFSDGTDVGIAIIDSGVNDHPDFKDRTNCKTNRLVYKQNFVAGETTTNDLFGHGTHVAGIVAGVGKCAETSTNRTFRGIAPDAKIISLRVLNALGLGTDSAVIAAIDRAIALKSTYNIRVINLSLGRPIKESYTIDPLCQAVEKAWKAGIVVVVSAGNLGRFSQTNGYGTITSPGNDPFVITVGAMNDKSSTSKSDDVMTTYSSKGPTTIDHVVKPDLLAPGNSIVSMRAPGTTLDNLMPSNVVNRSYYKSGATGASQFYFKMSGTSMAAPMGSGAAAVLIGNNSALTPNQVKARLMKTATKAFPVASAIVDPVTNLTYQIQYDVFTVGAGYIDVNAALNNTSVMSTSSTTPLSPKVKINTIGQVTLDSQSLVWGDSLVWGESLVWGTQVFISGSSLVWGDSLVWGNSFLSGYSLVWGDSICQGNSLVWGDNIVFSQYQLGDQ